MSRQVFFGVALAGASVWGMWHGGPAYAADLEVEGGPGGGYFRVTCPDGGYVVGLDGRTGAWIDGVRPICGIWDNASKRLRVTGPHRTYVGGPEGGPSSAPCPDGSIVTGMEFANTWSDKNPHNAGYVHHITIRCRAVIGNDTVTRLYGPATRVEVPSGMLILTANQECRNGEIATGLHGRAGTYIDALALICGPAPVVGTPLGKRGSESAAVTPQPDRPGRPLGKQNQSASDKPGRPLGKQNHGVVLSNEGFTGTWNTKTDKNWSYLMTLVQDGREVTGSYVAQDNSKGRIKGRVGANIMEFNWEQDGGYTGTGQFALAADGNSFSGIYRANPHPNLKDPRLLQGAWSGTRK